MTDAYETVRVEVADHLARVTLNRPDIRNAFNEVMLRELREVFGKLAEDDDVRAIVLTGEGKAFCAGADLHWMRRVLDFDFQENYEDSLAVADLMRDMYQCPKPVIGRVNGPAIGGGVGFVAVCDIVVAVDTAVFSFSEVKIGLVPACISPFVLKRVGERYAREYFLSGERLTAEKALACGLVNHVVPAEQLDATVDEILGHLLTSGPDALAVCKRMVREVADLDLAKAGPRTAELLAHVRMGAEGQEGMSAFLERRRPNWHPKTEKDA
jgi:methylglutaconyl-CoA hydratase